MACPTVIGIGHYMTCPNVMGIGHYVACPNVMVIGHDGTCPYAWNLSHSPHNGIIQNQNAVNMIRHYNEFIQNNMRMM